MKSKSCPEPARRAAGIARGLRQGSNVPNSNVPNSNVPNSNVPNSNIRPGAI